MIEGVIDHNALLAVYSGGQWFSRCGISRCGIQQHHYYLGNW